jgi:hypothetical protein
LGFAEEHGLSALNIGHSTNSGRLKLKVARHEVLDSDVKEIHEVWSNAIPQQMNQN